MATKTKAKSGAKSWQEKLANNKPPVTKTLAVKYADIPAGEKMFIANPQLVDGYIRSIPQGQSKSTAELRQELAAANGAYRCCPLSTGIFIRIVAEAAYEQYQQGQPLSSISPFWRVIAPDSPASKKLSFDLDFIRKQRNAEGISTS